MTPMHPKLRAALQREILKIKKEPTSKLAAKIQLHFEDVITRRFYQEKYRKQGTARNSSVSAASTQASSFNTSILAFQNDYMPGYKKIQQKWVNSQRAQLMRDPFTLNPIAIVKNSFVLFGKWIAGTVLRRFHLRTMPEVQAKE